MFYIDALCFILTTEFTVVRFVYIYAVNADKEEP